MGFRDYIKGLFWRRDLSPSDPRGWVTMGGMATASDVDHDKALGLSEVYAAVKNCSEDLAALPLLTYSRLPDGGRERLDDHYTQDLLQNEPNPYMTGQELREAIQGQVELRGNGYAEIERDGSGRPLRLWPLRADLVEPFIGTDGALYYAIGCGASQRVAQIGGVVLPARLVLHLRGFSGNGLVGYDPITLHREGLTQASALQEYSTKFYSNGSRPGGILTHPGKLSPEAKKNLRESWELAHRGLQQAHRVALLEEGITWTQVGIAPENAQYIESRKLKVSDAARIWRYPPHMLGDLDRATFSNMEQQALEYVVYTLMPRAKRWEGRIRQSILGEDRRSVFVEHLFSGLLRGDTKGRYAAYAIARQWGWMSVNDIRALENMNPIGPEGDHYLEPLNMHDAGDPLPDPSATEPPPPQPEAPQ